MFYSVFLFAWSKNRKQYFVLEKKEEELSQMESNWLDFIYYEEFRLISFDSLRECEENKKTNTGLYTY